MEGEEGETPGKLLKNYPQVEIQSPHIEQRYLKSPVKKGDLKGIQALIKSPLTPLFQRGG